MNLRAWRFLTLLLASLGSSFGAAHVLELPPRMQYDPVLYAAVTSTLYRWFGIFGAIVQVGAILAAARLTLLVRGRPGFRWTLFGVVALLLSVALWAALVQPVNAAWAEALRSAPDTVPAEYARLRNRWEYGHVAGFCAWLAGFCLLVRSVIVETPRGGSREGTAGLTAAALCYLLAVAGCDRQSARELPADRDGETAMPEADTAVVGADAVHEAAPGETLVMERGGQLSRRPVTPLRIEGACPFECCTYGAWTTTAATTIYEEPDESAASYEVPAGSRLDAATGYVLLTRIGVAVARDTVRVYDDAGGSRLVAAGDTLLVLDDVGEGYRRVWHAGAIWQTDAASALNVAPGAPKADLLVEPQREWWARVRTADGRAGWLWMDRTPRIEGADACG